MQHQLEKSHARVRQLESAVHEAEREGARDLAAARCSWDTLHQEEAQELRVSDRHYVLKLAGASSAHCCAFVHQGCY